MRLLMTILSLVAVISSSPVFAENIPTGPCLAKVGQLQNWPTIATEQAKCMDSDPEFAKAIVYLCSKDQTTLSIQYQKYLSAKETYEKALQKYYHSTDSATRAMAALDMQNAEEDWSLAGFRPEVDAALNTANQIHFHCVPQ